MSMSAIRAKNRGRLLQSPAAEVRNLPNPNSHLKPVSEDVNVLVVQLKG